MADYLHEDILINILHRLPVETLLCCTSVCKSWYSLITSPLFISSHLQFSAAADKAAPPLLVRRCIGNSERYDLYSDNQSSFALSATWDFPFRSINSFFTVVGSCNGLLCLSDDRVYYMHTIILWNPCIRKSVLLPKPDPNYSPYSSFIQSLGFGFDPVGGDYKLVRITYVDQLKPQMELYKLSTGVWRDISHLALDCVIYNRSRQAYVNGATHWIARCCTDFCDLIVLFDMSDDVFRKMMLPVSLVNDDDDGALRSKDLVVFMDSLALIACDFSRAEPKCCVWVMKEYGVEESWSKHLSFDSQDFGGRFIRPLWVRKCGEVVITGWKDGDLYSYYPNGAEVKDLGVHGSRSEDYGRSIRVDGYTKSLVLLERGPYSYDALTCAKLPNLQAYDRNSMSSCGASGYNCNDHGCFSGNRNVAN